MKKNPNIPARDLGKNLPKGAVEEELWRQPSKELGEQAGQAVLGGEHPPAPQIPSKLISPPRPLTRKLWENERFKQLLWDQRQMWHLENLSSWEPP